MIESSYSSHPIEMLPDEDRLVRQAKSGDADAFAQLFDACFEHVYRYVTFRVESDRVAEAISTRVFFKTWEQLDRYQVLSSPILAWLYSIARDEISAYYRTHRRTAIEGNGFGLTAKGGYSGEEVQDMLDMQAMRAGLQSLTEDDQEYLILRFVAGLSTRNIAHIMSRHDGQVRTLQFRALQRLTSYLKEKEIL